MESESNVSISHAFALVRFDVDRWPVSFENLDALANKLKIVKVVPTREKGESELARLSVLNADKKCKYCLMIVKLEFHA